jgi:hypothetical protein
MRRTTVRYMIWINGNLDCPYARPKTAKQVRSLVLGLAKRSPKAENIEVARIFSKQRKGAFKYRYDIILDVQSLTV